MALVSNTLVQKIRQYFAREREGKMPELYHPDMGTIAGRAYMSGYSPELYDMFLSAGLGGVGQFLRLEEDLTARYQDYEEMNLYPEIACLTRDTKIAIVGFDPDKKENPMSLANVSMVSLGKLAERKAQYPDEPLYVLSMDIARKKIVPAVANGPIKTGIQVPVFKVTFAEYRSNPGQPKKKWTIRATAEHLFMLRDGSYTTLANLRPGDRLMPCATRIAKSGYFQVRSPWTVASTGGPNWDMAHTLVAQEFLLNGGEVPKNCVVHHIDGNKTNAHPKNLRIESWSNHSYIHNIVKTPEARQKISTEVKKYWQNPEEKLSRARAHFRDGGNKSYMLGNPVPKGILTEEHRAKIAAGHTIPIGRDTVEAAVRTSCSLNDAAKKVGVSWNTLVRRMEQMGIGRELLGTSVQSQFPGETGYQNHVVVSVEADGFDDVYDVEVPKYHNFAAEGIFVHNSAFEIFADDASQVDVQTGQSVEVEADDQQVKRRILEMLKRVKIEDEIWGITHTLVRYGNEFSELILKEGEGVIGLNNLPPPTVRRVESQKGGLMGFVYDLRQAFNMTPQELVAALKGEEVPPELQAMGTTSFFEDYEVVHFRMRGQYRNTVYGMSIAESARWIWRRLSMLEDSAMIYKLTRSPSRFAFYVDVGDQPPRQAKSYLNSVRQTLKKQRYINPVTGRMDFRLNPMSSLEDFFIPVRNGRKGTEIEVLGGPSYQSMEDIEYFRSKLFAALKVPKLFMNFDENTIGRATLSTEDVRFARSVLRVQRELRNGLKKMAQVHLITTGLDPSAVDYEIYMTTPSAIFELAQLEVQNARADLATRVKDFVSQKWILDNVFGLNDEEIEIVYKQAREDQLRTAETEVYIDARKIDLGKQIEKERAAKEAAEAAALAAIQGVMPGGVPGIPGGPGEVVAPKGAPVEAPEEAPEEEPEAEGAPEELIAGESKNLRKKKYTTFYDMERKLTEGNKDLERRLQGKLGSILQNDKALLRKFSETRAFLQELRGTMKGSRRREQ